MRYLSQAKPKELAKRALVRLDFNTEDEWRMEACLPTVRLLVENARSIVIVSHRGRPEGPDPKLSLRKDALALQKFIRRKVIFIPHHDFGKIKEEMEAAPSGSIFVLENLRFHPAEGHNDAKFARELATLADFYVNDAFAVSHRAAASVDAITRFLPSYAGLELEQEVRSLGALLKKPKKPLVLVIGGAKAHDKLGVIKFFADKASSFLLGGAAANTLLFLQGTNVGSSLIDKDEKDYKELRKALKFPNLHLPLDWRMSGKAILDIGAETEKMYADHIRRAKAVIWSGPMGFIEKKGFAKGNLAIAKAIAANHKAFSVTGGGETVMFLKKHKLDRKFSFISTGGGALVDFLAGEKLPGLVALDRKASKK
jgi:phosphoglycerate kinase